MYGAVFEQMADLPLKLLFEATNFGEIYLILKSVCSKDETVDIGQQSISLKIIVYIFICDKGVVLCGNSCALISYLNPISVRKTKSMALSISTMYLNMI